MGLGQDYLNDNAYEIHNGLPTSMDRPFESAKREANSRVDEVWTTRDGRQINVGDMDVNHLRNTLRHIIRTQRAREILGHDASEADLY